MNTPVRFTDSFLVKWWLTTFCGYRVVMVRRVPRLWLLGSIIYENHWKLQAKERA